MPEQSFVFNINIQEVRTGQFLPAMVIPLIDPDIISQVNESWEKAIIDIHKIDIKNLNI